MTDHSTFIIMAYLITFIGCGLLVFATLMRGHRLRKRLKHLSDD